MGVRNLVCECEHEAPIALDFLRGGLLLEQLDSVTQMLQAVLLQFLGRVVVLAVAPGLRCHDLVE